MGLGVAMREMGWAGQEGGFALTMGHSYSPPHTPHSPTLKQLLFQTQTLLSGIFSSAFSRAPPLHSSVAWTSHSSSLRLGFLVYEMGKVIPRFT